MNTGSTAFGKTYTGLRFSSIPIPQGGIYSAVIMEVPCMLLACKNTSTATVEIIHISPTV